jgi:hypothetical protein
MTDALIVVQPIQITDAMLVSTDVPETDYAVWAYGTFAVGDRRIMTTGIHKIYECASDHTSTGAGGAPNLNLDGSPILWVKVSADNRWKCFDTSNSTQTVKSASAQYVLKPGQSVSHVSLLNATNVNILRVQLDSDAYGLVYDRTVFVALILTESSWYAWYFDARGSVSALFLDDIPNYPDGTFTIDIVSGMELAFGVLMLGQGTTIGQGAQYGARVSIQDYSRKETDAFGASIFVQRDYAKRASFNMRLLESEVDLVNEFLAAVRSIPCLWIGASRFTTTFIFGTYESFETTINYGDSSDCALSLLGLT